MGRLVSVNVGLPRDVAWRGEKVHTAIWKQPVQGRIAVRRLNVEGDGQGDLAGHGGEHRAVMVYQMDAYRYWEAQLGRNDFSFGQFGENFTVVGLPDGEVCIGDRYRIGSALFEVTQPRVTCYRVGIRMAEPAMAALLVSHHRPGFYCRVLEEGEVGVFLVLRLRTTPSGPMLLRNYSMSGMPGARTYRVSVKRETNGVVSSYLHDRVGAGDMLEVSAPRGDFILRPGDAPVVLLSAGIGATPVLAMLHSLSSAASRRKVWWIYGARKRAAHPFAKESRGLLQTLVNSRSYIVYSRPDSGDEPGVDYDAVGHVDTPLLDRLGVTRDSDFYLCGPPSFLEQLTQGLKTWGADSTRIYQEVFGPEAPITPGIARSSRPPVHAPVGEPGIGPQISFIRSGLTVPWDSRLASLLELAEACDVPGQWSCRTGVCHTCECALIGGTVNYQPEPLEPPAAGNLLICCSTPSGEVEVDL